MSQSKEKQGESSKKNTYCSSFKEHPPAVNKVPDPVNVLNLPKKQPQNKNMINLENILLIEKKLSSIISHFQSSQEISSLCEDWWELSQEETMLQNLGNVFKEPRYKTCLKTGSILETLSISLCH